MRRVFFALVLVALARTARADELSERARALVDRLSRADWTAAAEHFDAKMREVLPPAKLELVWGQVTASCGAFQRAGEPRAEKVAGAEARFVRCDFEKMALD